ncbi:MAG: DUF697 domain-containing protein, partial [Rhodospirillaceae bacterium]|nr:DUF697 domain-containing protein [Rhodospirillaceae bacterium]
MSEKSTNTAESGEYPMHATINKDRLSEASSIITKYSAFAFGGGVIPFPMMDIAAVSGIQIKMLAEIARLYEVEFVDNWGKSTLTALIGGAVPHWLAVGTVGSLIKAIPVLGSAIGFATMPLLSAATTYAVGKVFVQHFESGGTFLDFDVQMAKDVFKEHFAKGKQVFMEQAANFKLRRNCDATEAETPAAQPVDVEGTPVT